jgi:hypothetical protein
VSSNILWNFFPSVGSGPCPFDTKWQEEGDSPQKYILREVWKVGEHFNLWLHLGNFKGWTLWLWIYLDLDWHTWAHYWLINESLNMRWQSWQFIKSVDLLCLYITKYVFLPWMMSILVIQIGMWGQSARLDRCLHVISSKCLGEYQLSFVNAFTSDLHRSILKGVFG